MKIFEKYIIKEGADEKNPKLMFNGIDTSLLVQIAQGKLKTQEYAKYELQNRGFGKKGEWVGFEDSQKIWKSKIK
jgi:hypothetical protein